MDDLKTCRVAIAAAAFALGVLPFGAALASDTKTTLAVDIESQPLEAALFQLSRLGNLQLVISTRSMPTRMSEPLHGTMPLGVALDVLLKDTGLTYKFVGEFTVAIINPATQLSGSATLPEGGADLAPAAPLSDAATAQTNENHNQLSDRKMKMTINGSSRTRLLGLFAACGAAAAGSGVCAQETSDATAADGKALVEEVVVTGSRVITNGNESPTPVTVLSMDELAQANPGNLATAMMMMPALLGTPNQGGQAGNNFQAVLNLRGMGGVRNLVLFDGHRVQSTTQLGGIQSGVDSNLIPTMLLKRVDVVTGGASAVYGSEAVSGVINYIVDNNFNGVKVNLQRSQSDYHDDEAYNYGIAAGTSLFGGRGHVEFSVQRIVDPGIPDRFARDWGREVWSMQGSVPGSTAAAGSQANPYALVKNSRFAVTNFGGVINTGALSGLQFAQNGVLSPFVHGAATGSSTIESGGDGGYFNTYPAFGEQRQDLGLGRFDFSFTDTTKAYVEVVAGMVLNYNPLDNTEVRTRAVGWNNAYLASVQQPYQATIAAQLAANPLGSFNFSRIFTRDQMPEQIGEYRGRQYMYLAGLDGSLGAYKWNLGYEHSDATTTVSNPNNISFPRLFAAMNAVTVTTANVGSSGLALGSIACNARLVNPAAYGGCVPLNLFGPTASNAAVFDYIRNPTAFRVAYRMDDVTASLAGSPFSSWAGPVQLAVSGDWRRQDYEISTNAQSTDPVNCTGIQFNCNATTTPYVGAVTNAFPRATVTVHELALETQVPLLTDKFLASNLAFNGAVRYTNYSESGVVWTWKAGLTWALNDSVSLRGTRSRDIRAPNQQQLFSPFTCNNNTFTDIHTNNTTNTVASCSAGNLNLTPEKADTYTLGVIWTPQFIPGLSVSLDGYHIDLKDGLNALSATQPASQLACEASGGASAVCDMYIRPFPFDNRTPANFPTQVIGLTLNTGGVLTKGVDAEIDYARPLWGRKFSTRLLLNYQPTLTYDLGPAGLYYIGGAADGIQGMQQTPDWKGVLQVNYEVLPQLTATVQERYRNALKQHGSPLLFFAIGNQPSAAYTDLTLNYRVSPAGGDLNLFLNVRNLFDSRPDPWAATGANARPGSLGGYVLGDDVVGRFYTVGLRFRL
jgi:iron complex outermembrane receptor protein